MMKKHYLFLLTILCFGFFNANAQDVIDCDPIIPGCTDETACNYNADANSDDESCEYCFNNDCEANPIDLTNCDGTCVDLNENDVCDVNEIGCSDALACNPYYFLTPNGDELIATEDDGSCYYAALDFNCDGTCIDVDEDSICDKVDDFICATDVDNDGVCDDNEVFSVCADETACNYVAGSTETYNENPAITMPEDMEVPDTYGCIYPVDADGNETIWFDCTGACIDTDNDNICDEVDACPDDAQNDADGDGVCANLEIEGCTDVDAFNYDPTVGATEDDGSCEDVVEGCMDETACNYLAEANTDSGDCDTADEGFNCDGSCIDVDADDVCDSQEIAGCTDSTATNYDQFATDDDGSCIAVVEGCNADAFADGVDSTDYFIDTDANTACADNDNDGIGDCCEMIMEGCMDETACNYDATANTDSGDCDPGDVGFNCDGSCVDLDGDTICDLADDCVGTIISFDTDEDGENDCDVCDDSAYAATYQMGTCNGTCVNGDDDTNGTCDDYEIQGCMDASACNYNEDATQDDGSCFNPACDSDCDEESGVFTDGDADNDGVCDENEVLGCTDTDACNYDVADGATEDDGSCEYPAEGYSCDGSCVNTDALFGEVNEFGVEPCDLADDCVGNYDSCGVCNGEGPTQEFYICEMDDNGDYIEVCATDSDGDGICDENEVAGCNDESACNYDPLATDLLPGSCEGTVGCGLPYMSNYNPLAVDDCEGDDCGTADCINNDSCIEYVPGCYDVTACNYEGIIDDENQVELAGWVDDGSCEFASCTGCTDDTACNYDASMSIADDTMCLFTDDYINSEGDCAYFDLDTDGDGVLDYMEVDGCTDSSACNYDADATEDDGSCEDGCDTCNYDADGNFESITDGDSDGDGVCDDDELAGCTDMMACNYNPDATDLLEGSCEGTIGCSIPSMMNFDANSDCLSNDAYSTNEACIEFALGCTDENACNYDAAANFNTNCIYPAEVYLNCDGSCINDCDEDGICDEAELVGCTDPEACNTNYYDDGVLVNGNNPTSDDGSIVYTLATDDDGSCIPYSCGQEWSINFNPDAGDCVDNTLCEDWLLGCTDVFACNYDVGANWNDGTCEYAAVGEITDPLCQECTVNADGELEVTLIDTDGDGIGDCETTVEGCTDAAACNWNPNANSDDGSCVIPGTSCTTDEGEPGSIVCGDNPNTSEVEDYYCEPDGSIEDVTSSFGLLIYPNPADDYITIELDSYDYEDARITIINQLGQIVVSHTTSTFSTTNINVGNYPTGLYQVSVATERDIVNKSLLIK